MVVKYVPQSRACPDCGAPQSIMMRLLHDKDPWMYRLLLMGMIQIRGTILIMWHCPSGHFHDAGTRFRTKPDPEPVRPEIVDAIRRLKKAGHRFFDWEKRNA